MSSTRCKRLFLTCDLISPTQAAISYEKGVSAESLISVLQPSSIDQSVLRPSLLPGLLQVVKYNCDHQNHNIRGFEVGRIHFKESDVYKEQTTAAIIMTGDALPYHFDPKPKEVDFFDIKGIVENLCDATKTPTISFEPSHFHHLHPFRQARLKIGDLTLGVIGEVHPTQLMQLGIEQRLFFAEINLHELLPLLRRQEEIATFSIFPSSERDWTVTLKEELPIHMVMHCAKNISSPILEKLLLLDLYKSEQIGKDRKNATFRFIYRDLNRTLSLEEVEKEHTKIIQEIAKNLPL